MQLQVDCMLFSLSIQYRPNTYDGGRKLIVGSVGPWEKNTDSFVEHYGNSNALIRELLLRYA